MARLIINADDFGLTLGVNRAIGELANAKVLSSATLMACGPAFDDAVRVAHQSPTLAVGCHVVLVDGLATAAPTQVPSLLKHTYPLPLFRSSLAKFAYLAQSGRIDARHIEAEATAQIQKLQAAGIHVTHVDTHKHTHMFPSVAGPVLRAAHASGIRAIRNPFEPKWCTRFNKSMRRNLIVNALRSRFAQSLRSQPLVASGEMVMPDGSIGVSATGSLTRDLLRCMLSAIPDGTWELVTHPGYCDADLKGANTRLLRERDVERQALLEEVRASGHDLITFADLQARAR